MAARSQEACGSNATNNDSEIADHLGRSAPGEGRWHDVIPRRVHASTKGRMHTGIPTRSAHDLNATASYTWLNAPTGILTVEQMRFDAALYRIDTIANVRNRRCLPVRDNSPR